MRVLVLDKGGLIPELSTSGSCSRSRDEEEGASACTGVASLEGRMEVEKEDFRWSRLFQRFGPWQKK
jgi:hypothetical protein